MEWSWCNVSGGSLLGRDTGVCAGRFCVEVGVNGVVIQDDCSVKEWDSLSTDHSAVNLFVWWNWLLTFKKSCSVSIPSFQMVNMMVTVLQVVGGDDLQTLKYAQWELHRKIL